MTTNRTLALTILLALAPCAAARAQDDDAPTRDVTSIQEQPGFAEALADVAGGREAKGVATFQKLVADHPDEPDLFIARYNLACGLARLKQVDAAFAELKQAVELGYGLDVHQIENLGVDPDLESLRGDARFAPIVARAKELSEKIAASYQQMLRPFVWLPPAPDAAATKKPAPLLPLLIVLHPFGVERESFARKWFLPFAQQHGFALLAPSGTLMLAPGHFAWRMAPGDFLEKFRDDQTKVWESLVELETRAAIDPERIYVAGAGQGAALGFALAIRNPQWVRGAVLFGGGYSPLSIRDWREAAAPWKHRIALVHGREDPIYPFAPLPAFVESCRKDGLGVQLFEREGGHELAADAAALGARLEELLRWIDEAPFVKPSTGGAPAIKKPDPKKDDPR